METASHVGTTWDQDFWLRVGFKMLEGGTALATPGELQFSGTDFWVDSNAGWNALLNRPW